MQSGATVADTSTGTGLGGAPVHLASLFGAGNTATITFTTSAGVGSSSPLYFDISGATGVGLPGSSVSFSSGVIQAVPEPSGLALIGAGLAALLGLRFVRMPRPAKARR